MSLNIENLDVKKTLIFSTAILGIIILPILLCYYLQIGMEIHNQPVGVTFSMIQPCLYDNIKTIRLTFSVLLSETGRFLLGNTSNVVPCIR